MANINRKKQPDFRQIKTESDKKALTDLYDKDIEASEAEMTTSGMHDIWELNNLYYESAQVPLGASSDFMKEYVNKTEFTATGRFDTRKFKTQKTKDGNIFVVDNRIKEIVDGKDAEFADANRQLIVKNDDNPRNNRIEKAVQTYITKLENRHQIWDQCRFPAIQMKHRQGLAWVQVDWNQNINYGGDIEWSVKHPRNVLLDVMPEMKFFLDAKYIIPKIYMPIDEAAEYLAQFGIEESQIQPDEDYFYKNETLRSRHRTNEAYTANQDFVTLYFPEYKRIYTDRYGLHDITGNKADDDGRRVANTRAYYFRSIYNKKLGLIDHREAKYYDPSKRFAWQFSCIPYYENMSWTRLFPLSLVEKLLNIQDVINIMESLILNNARQRNKIRLFVNKKLEAQYGKVVNDVLNSGGIAYIDSGNEKLKDNMEFAEIPGLADETYKFLDLMDASIKNQGQRKEVLGGKLPDARSEYLSGKSIEKLTERNLVRLQPDQLSVNWSASQEARRAYSIMAEETDTGEWMEIEEDGEAKEVPIRVTMSGAEFNAYLTQKYPNIDLYTAFDTFAEENIVHVTQLRVDPETGEKLTPEEVAQIGTEVRINHLFDKDGKPYNLDIKVEFDFDFKVNEQSTTDTLVRLWEQNPQNNAILLRVLKRIPGLKNESDKIVKDIESGNQALQLGNAVIERGPEFAQQVGQAIMQFDAMQQMAKQGGKGAGQQGNAGQRQLMPAGV